MRWGGCRRWIRSQSLRLHPPSRKGITATASSVTEEAVGSLKGQGRVTGPSRRHITATACLVSNKASFTPRLSRDVGASVPSTAAAALGRSRGGPGGSGELAGDDWTMAALHGATLTLQAPTRQGQEAASIADMCRLRRVRRESAHAPIAPRVLVYGLLFTTSSATISFSACFAPATISRGIGLTLPVMLTWDSTWSVMLPCFMSSI